jgi:hypothetical protein
MVRIVMLGFVLLAVMLIIIAGSAWRIGAESARRRLLPPRSASRSGLCAARSPSDRGYRALTHEVIAATITTEPIGPQRFRATVTLADNSLHMFDLAGDAVSWTRTC